MLRRRHGMRAHRGARASRPHNTGASTIGSDRQWRQALLGQSPCGFGRQGGRVRHCRETERHDTAVHAGGTPALPGGAPLSIGLASRGDTRGGSLPHRRHTQRHAGNACGRDARAPGWGASFHWSCFSRGHAGLAPCRIAILSGMQRECMRAGRPRSRVGRVHAVPADAWLHARNCSVGPCMAWTRRGGGACNHRDRQFCSLRLPKEPAPGHGPNPGQSRLPTGLLAPAQRGNRLAALAALDQLVQPSETGLLLLGAVDPGRCALSVRQPGGAAGSPMPWDGPGSVSSATRAGAWQAVW